MKGKGITLVDFIANFLRPYKDLPEFVPCVLKALEILGTPSAIKNPKTSKSCPIKKPTKSKIVQSECIE